MLIFSDNGVNIGKHLVIDPSKSQLSTNVVISHGHTDHVKLNSSSRFVFSKETADIIASRFHAVENSIALPFEKPLALDDLSISLHSSGHILGSAQVMVESSSATVAITSDFKLQDSLIQPKAKILQPEILVIESTFGLPCFNFPERERVYEQIGKWVKEKSKSGFVVLAGYSLGKAQELTAIVNRYAGIVPLVHESIYKNNQLYERLGVKLGKYIKLEHNLRESSVLIMPPSLVNHNLLRVLEYSLHKRIYSAIATGWQMRNGYNAAFPLSDHADFNQLLQYVREAKPSMVLTMHGYEREFANYVQRRLHIPARSLEAKGQKVLREFI